MNGQQLQAFLDEPLVRLDEERSQPLTAPSSINLHLFDTVSSTNQILWRLIEAGATEGTVVIARQQIAGRGQWGRVWQSLPGGLYLSLALMPELAIAASNQLILVTAWGIAAAFRQYGIAVGVKWLNDLVIDGYKLGGILAETRIRQGCIHQVVLGIGINWANPVPETGINLQSWMATQNQQSIDCLERCAAIVLQGAFKAYRYWQMAGVDAVLPQYQEMLTSVGHSVTVNDCLGTVIGVSRNGELRVRLPVTDNPLGGKDVYLKPGTVRLGYGDRNFLSAIAD